MKSTFFAILTLLTSVGANAQTISEFFIPSAPNNKATLYTPSQTGGRTGMTRVIYYIKKGDYFEITDAPMMDGQPSSIQTRTVTLTNNEVRMTKSVSTTMFETNRQRTHNPPIVLLAMPANGQTKKWSYTQISGDVVNCTTTWTTVNVDNQELKAIKLEEEVVDGFGISIEYYVQGIGLWKTDFKGSDGKVQPFERFDQLSNDPTAR